MSHIVSARVYANNEIAVIAWAVDGFIAGCVGFELTRIYPETGEEVPLAAWVPFKKQSNKDWIPQTTGVWPVQKLMWRDLTARKRRSAMERRPADVQVKYRIRPLAKAGGGREKVKNLPKKTYKGLPVPLSYIDEGMETNEVTLTMRHGDIRAAFTNGILSAQWLRHALEEKGEKLTPDGKSVLKHMKKKGDPLREYLSGDVLGLLREFLDRDENDGKVRLALYELGDEELKDAIKARSKTVDMILSNSSKDADGVWDGGNAEYRLELSGVLKKHQMDRIFNNNHIGHNKFCVYADSAPREVLTGSTNWTPTGLCGQSNNAMIIKSDDLAQAYSAYWDRLLKDTSTKPFARPKPLSKGTSNKQSATLRSANATPVEVDLSDGTHVTFWAAPNTKEVKKNNDVMPPDLQDLYSRMRKADDAILFAVFMPSQSGKTSIVAEAIEIGRKDPSVLVYGSVSDPTAMPNYVPPPRKKKGEDVVEGEAEEKTPSPATFDERNVHVVRAAALIKADVIGDFENELLKVGHAIIHDKIVVVDPLSKNGFVAMGSHNLGYKASYENDENLLINRNNQSLTIAYAMHVLDVYDHYRFRAVQLEMHNKKKKPWSGFLDADDHWMRAWLADKGDLSRYLSR